MKFKLGCEVTVSAYTEVEADTLEEAIQHAKDREVVIGGLHSGTSAAEQWIIDDADGLPSNIKEQL
jgi:hypothetical protein